MMQYINKQIKLIYRHKYKIINLIKNNNIIKIDIMTKLIILKNINGIQMIFKF